MKDYEGVPNIKLTKCLPVIVRIDGRSFHTVTKGFCRPFDKIFIKTMQETLLDLCKEVQNCRFGYVESDEISLLLYPQNIVDAEYFFDNKVEKICSITASIASVSFYRHFIENTRGLDNPAYKKVVEGGISFDSRCFSIPLGEVVNYFIWRQQDCTKNSLNMVARSYFSAKQLDKKNCSQRQEMLFSEKGVNWNDFETVFKRGTACKRVPVEKPVIIGDREKIISRNEWQLDYEMPILTQERNYIL